MLAFFVDAYEEVAEKWDDEAKQKPKWFCVCIKV